MKDFIHTSGQTAAPDAADVPSGTTQAANALRNIGQPKRNIYRYLNSKFRSGVLRPGGRIVVPHQTIPTLKMVVHDVTAPPVQQVGSHSSSPTVAAIVRKGAV